MKIHEMILTEQNAEAVRRILTDVMDTGLQFKLREQIFEKRNSLEALQDIVQPLPPNAESMENGLWEQSC